MPTLTSRSPIASRLSRVVGSALALVAWLAASPVTAQAPGSPPAPAVVGADAPPDDSVLGTVMVTGGAAVALPKLAVMPIITTNDPDTTLQLAVRNDLDLCGQFEIVGDSVMPPGPFLHETAVDAPAWRAKGVSIVVRVVAEKLSSGSHELLGSAYLVDRGATPVFSHRIETGTDRVRENAHRMADALLGALTGRPGGFASHLVFSSRVGRSRQVFTIDADGFNLKPVSPQGDTAITPTFGPAGEVYYAMSHDYSPFFVARGSKGTPVPLAVRGSVYGLSFSPDLKRMAVAIAGEATSRVYLGAPDGSGLSAVSTAALANHPIIGQDGKVAYVAGGEKGQRVYVDQRPVSPPGFNASAPAFCDTPNGVLIVFTVGVGSGADLLATDVRGGNLTRLTQNQGANSYPACSPDGRLLAFFSTRKTDKGPGLYVVPLANPTHARRISTELGESLRWAALPQ